jgi:hypothetical protein
VSAYFQGFVTDSGEKNQNFLLSDSYAFGPVAKPDTILAWYRRLIARKL